MGNEIEIDNCTFKLSVVKLLYKNNQYIGKKTWTHIVNGSNSKYIPFDLLDPTETKTSDSNIDFYFKEKKKVHSIYKYVNTISDVVFNYEKAYGASYSCRKNKKNYICEGIGKYSSGKEFPPDSYMRLNLNSNDTASRVFKAFNHLIRLCGGEGELF